MAEKRLGDRGFTRRPEEVPEVDMWRVIRVPPSGRVSVTILSHDLIGRYTHFFRRRSVPCMLPDTCEACNQGVPRRYHSWFCALGHKSGECAIVEITKRAVGYFDAAFRAHRTLRGLVAHMTRVPQGKENGKVHAIIEKPKVEVELPKSANIELILLQMWELPITLQIPVDERKAIRPLPGQKEFLA
jgi:hypothetical protein